MRQHLKSLTEAVLCGSGLPRLARRARRTGAVVLAYHNIVPDGATVGGDLSLHLRQSDFARQIHALRATHEIVPLAALWDAPASRPRAAITFDDAYRGALTAGRQVLEALEVPATVFVVTGHPGGTPFWWDRLAVTGFLSPRARAHATTALRGEHGRVRDWAGPAWGRAEDLPGHAVAATLPELAAALDHDGITLGSHTRLHPNLSMLGPAEVEEEMATSLEWLRRAFGERAVPLLSYPYGSWTPLVAELAARTGYRGAFRVDGGWAALGESEYRTRRINVPAGVSIRGFTLRTAGVLRA